MKLVIMTQPTFFVEEDKIISTLFDEGMDNLHLYNPDASPMYSERLLSLLPEYSYNKITVHDHFYLKNAYGLAGIHLDSPEKELPNDYKGKFSRSCMDIKSLPLAKKKAEYVFLQNVFSNEMDLNAPLLSRQALSNAAKNGLIDKHVYAFGGINIDNIKETRDFGFGGVVICKDLWNKFDIHNELDFKDLINHFEKLKKAIS